MMRAGISSSAVERSAGPDHLAGFGFDGIEASRRLEDWIVGTLVDGESTPDGEDWQERLGRMSLTRVGAIPSISPTSAKAKRIPGGWSKFRLARRRGITVLAITASSLIKEDDLEELSGDLLALVEAGHRRVVLNFAAVERLSTWAARTVAEMLDRYTADGDGMLKVCGLRPRIAGIFEVSGLGREVQVHPDEASAIESPWIKAPDYRPLPVAVLCALTRASDTTALTILPALPQTAPAPAEPSPVEGLPAMRGVRLVSRSGTGKDRAVSVDVPRFLIGRDRSCHLRIGSTSISRFHAAVEQRGGRLYLLDLGSTNGTILNGRTLRGEEAEVRHGDKIQVGPIGLTIDVGSGLVGSSGIEDEVAGWLGAPGEGSVPVDDAGVTSSELLSIDAGDDGLPRIKEEVIEGVLVETPLMTDLDSDVAIDALRSGLMSSFEGPLPRRLVVNLAHVGHLSCRAIGVLVAHHLRLDQAGGALRVCEANPRVAAVLEQVRLSMLIDCHATLDDAVLTSWQGVAEDDVLPVG
jgi:anti-anti-sigma factor